MSEYRPVDENAKTGERFILWAGQDYIGHYDRSYPGDLGRWVTDDGCEFLYSEEVTHYARLPTPPNKDMTHD